MLTLSYSLVDDSTYDGWSDTVILGNTPRKRFSVFRDTLHTLVIFQISIKRPIKQLMMMTKLVSLSRMYSSTIKDWKTLKKTDRTERPARDSRVLQN